MCSAVFSAMVIAITITASPVTKRVIRVAVTSDTVGKGTNVTATAGMAIVVITHARVIATER
jgi:hypothetical protein